MRNGNRPWVIESMNGLEWYAERALNSTTRSLSFADRFSDWDEAVSMMDWLNAEPESTRRWTVRVAPQNK